MPVAIREGRGLTRRKLLVRSASTIALAGLGGFAMPYLSRAADRPRIEGGIASGDVAADSAVIWARSDRAARMVVECATDDSFKAILGVASAEALPDFGLHFEAAARRVASRAGYFLSRALREYRGGRDFRRIPGRAFPHRAGGTPLGVVRLVRRYRGPGLGHRSRARRYANVSHHAGEPAGFLHPLRRPHLCGLSDRG